MVLCLTPYCTRHKLYLIYFSVTCIRQFFFMPSFLFIFLSFWQVLNKIKFTEMSCFWDQELEVPATWFHDTKDMLCLVAKSKIRLACSIVFRSINKPSCSFLLACLFIIEVFMIGMVLCLTPYSTTDDKPNGLYCANGCKNHHSLTIQSSTL